MQCGFSEVISNSSLYLVPTPIGNFGDITCRALFVLKNVDLIAAENIRHTNLLLKHFNIKASLFLLHEHNEYRKIDFLLSKIKLGKSIALVSNAGTPVINDPGYLLVCSCHNIGIKVIPLPGACAAITALSASGLPTNRFCYEGFLPSKRNVRLKKLKSLVYEQRTLIFYDVPHRLLSSLRDMKEVFGCSRHVVLAKELTKIWETIYSSTLADLLNAIILKKIYCRGELVLIIKGYQPVHKKLTSEVLQVMDILMTELSIKKSISLVSNIYGIKKQYLSLLYLNK